MKIDQVVYLTQTPFSKRDADRFGVDIFKSHGVDVAVVDMTPYLDRYVAKNYVLNSDETFDYVIQLDSYRTIKQFILDRPKDTLFISFIGESSVKALGVLDLLYKYNKEFGIIFSGSLPLGATSNFSNRLKLLTIKNIWRLIAKAFYISFLKKYHFSFVVASGKKSYDMIENKYSNSKIVQGHAFDYDLYLDNELKNIEQKNKKKYALFLDEFFPFHPDYMRHGIDYSDLADSYYKKLNKLFDYIEQKYNLDIIISAHPRSYYDRLPEYWNGRKHLIGNTIELVKEAEFCLTHASTSINFAVLYNKPIMLVTMDELKDTNVQPLLETMNKVLNTVYIDLDKDVPQLNLLDINKKKYEDYKTNYIKMPMSEEINNWEILYQYYMDKQ